MSVPIVAFFNNKGGVGKTSLVYHLAWMYRDLGLRVLAADFDPQANLTAALLNEERLEEIWLNEATANTVFRCVRPLLRGIGDLVSPELEEIAEGLHLLVGDLQLSGFEDELSAEWSGCLDRKERSFRIISAFWRLLQMAIAQCEAEIVVVDLGPNLGAINRAGLIASDFVVVPLSPDLFSLQGLKNLGPTLQRWRGEWQERIFRNPIPQELTLPTGKMQPMGYVTLQHAIRLDRPVYAYQRWLDRIPEIYHHEVLRESDTVVSSFAEDPHRLATLKNYQSLMPLAQEARKPMFHLKPADGAIGAHVSAVGRAYDDFKNLACRIAEEIALPVNI